jgi:1,4-dihydroxy-2-naphthoyl-CoA synthase
MHDSLLTRDGGVPGELIVLAARSASFLQAFAKIGLIPNSGGTWFLTRRVGLARAKGLALLADKLPAEQAEQWGLSWKCIDDDALAVETMPTTRYLAALPTKALGMIKAALHASSGNSLDTQLDLERDRQRELGQSTDYMEGVSAFLQKRAPRLEGITVRLPRSPLRLCGQRQGAPAATLARPRPGAYSSGMSNLTCSNTALS